MSRFRSVKIFHDVIHRIDFSYLAEFFRFMGILVCEEILVEESPQPTSAEENTVYNASIYVGNRYLSQMEEKMLGSACPAAEYTKRMDKLKDQTIIWFYESPKCEELLQGGKVSADYAFGMQVCHLPKEDQKTILEELMDQVLNAVFEPEDPRRIDVSLLAGLIDVYVDHKLWFHDMNMQYFASRTSDAIKEARSAFLESHEAIKNILETEPKNSARFLYEYAKLWCEVKTNNACRYNGQILYFIQEKLASRCRALCAEYPEFSNAKVLLGLCYEPSINSANEALTAFQDALTDMKSECFGSAVYYWMGKRFEQYSSTRGYAEKSYECANDKKVKFRNIFKLAIFAKDREDYPRAIELFERIPQKLSLKVDMHFTDPLELEYLFKSYTQLCHCYYRVGNSVKVIEAGEKALEVLEHAPGDSQYFEVFYREEAASYRELLRGRCNPNVVYRMLAECYGKISNPDKMKEYQKLIQE